jgi:hypothetical protein
VLFWLVANPHQRWIARLAREAKTDRQFDGRLMFPPAYAARGARHRPVSIPIFAHRPRPPKTCRSSTGAAAGAAPRALYPQIRQVAADHSSPMTRGLSEGQGGFGRISHPKAMPWPLPRSGHDRRSTSRLNWRFVPALYGVKGMNTDGHQWFVPAVGAPGAYRGDLVELGPS